MGNAELNDAEEGIVSLSRALGCSEKRIIDILETGYNMDYGGFIPENILYFLDEMKATFDAY